MFRQRFYRRFSYLIILVSLPSLTFAQGQQADYLRADMLRTKLRDKVYHAPNAINWSASGKHCWYTIQTEQGKEFITVDPQTKTRQPAFDHSDLAQKLSDNTRKKYTAYALPFNQLTYQKEDQEIEFVVDGIAWQYVLASRELRNKGEYKPDSRNQRYWGASSPELSDQTVTSPDSNYVAFIRNYNVYIRSRKTRQEIQLSFDGSEGEYYSRLSTATGWRNSILISSHISKPTCFRRAAVVKRGDITGMPVGIGADFSMITGDCRRARGCSTKS